MLNGIDVLEKNNFKELQGLKIGLVTNHTGRDVSGKQTIDILKDAPGVKLVALFAPEHGIRGELDQAKIEVGQLDKVEPRTDTELIASNYRVNVYRARPVILIDGSQKIKLVTAAQSP